MTITTNGAISFSQLNTELGNSGQTQLSLANARVVGSVSTVGSVSVSQMYGGKVKLYNNTSTLIARPSHSGQWGTSVHGGYDSTVVITTAASNPEIRVYDFSTGSESLMWQKDSPSSGSSWGNSVAVTPHWIIVGAPFEDNTYTNDGTVYWYRRDSGLLEKEENAPNVGGGTDINANFGRYIVANDDFSAIVAPGERTISGNYFGRLYIYRNNGSSSSPVHTDTYGFTNSFASANIGDQRGLAMNDSHVFVGDNDNNSIYVFSITYATGTLTLQQTITDATNSLIGLTLAASNDWLLCRNNGNTVKVYRKTGTHTYSSYSSLSPSGTPSAFGSEIQINGNTAIIGDFTYSGVGYSGRITFFDIPSGYEIDSLANPNPNSNSGDQFGNLNTVFAGTSLVVGAPFEDVDGSNQGAVYYWGNPKAAVSLPDIRSDAYLNLTTTRYTNTSSVTGVISYLRFESSGGILHYADSGSKQVYKLLGNWLDRAVERSITGQSFWIRFTSVSITNGTWTGAGFNSWNQLSSDLAIGVLKSTNFTSAEGVATVEIATDSQGRNIIDTRNYTIKAEMDVNTNVPDVNLSGTSTTPVAWTNNDFARYTNNSSGYTGYRFLSNGDLEETKNGSSTNQPDTTEWHDGFPYGEYSYYLGTEWISRTGVATEYRSPGGVSQTLLISGNSPSLGLLNNLADSPGSSSGVLKAYITQQANYPPITVWDQGYYEVETYKEPNFSISSQTLSETSTAGSSCYAGFRIQPNGELYRCGPAFSELNSGGTLLSNQWADDTPQDPNGYWVYRTQNSWSSSTSFFTGTYYALSSNENAYVFRSSSSPGTTSLAGTLSVYRQNNSSQYEQLAFANITLSATVPSNDNISLSGTTSSATSFDTTLTSGPNATTTAGIRFESDGDLVKYSNFFQPNSSEWCLNFPTQTYYIRVSSYSTSSNSGGGSIITNGGLSTNVWYSSTSTRSWYVSSTSPSFNGTAFVNKVWKVEISTTSNGSNIIATGYYRTQATSINSF